MKYKAVIETDDFEDFQFFEDGSGKYIRGIDAGAVNNEWIPLYFTECEQEPALDKIRNEVLEYIDDLDIAAEICDIFNKYTSESNVPEVKE